MKYSQSTKNNDAISKDDEIELKYFFNRIIRKKLVLGYTTAFTLLISIILFLLTEKSWEGSFQIVLASQEKNLLGGKLPMPNVLPSKLISLQGPKPLETEVGILESPSVLMGIFDYVKKEKIKNNRKYEKITFEKWKENLQIELKKNTSILNISYIDKDKDLNLLVLEKISKKFQDYSGKSQRRTIALTKSYLNEQIGIYKVKSSESIKKAQQFAMSEDLVINNSRELGSSLSFNSIDNEKNNDMVSSPLNNIFYGNVQIEAIRAAAANQIRMIDRKLEKITNLKDDYEQLVFFSSTIPNLSKKDSLLKELSLIEQELIALRIKYTDKDRNIINLFERKKILMNAIKEKAIGYLKAERLATEAEMESAIRPEGILLKYKELMREAARDEITLINLENQLRAIKLREAKSEDPWELITKPTLIDDPIYPDLKINLFFGLLAGLISGSLLIKNIEKKSGLVFEKEIILNDLKSPLLIDNALEKENKIYVNSPFINDLIRDKINIFFLKINDISNDGIDIIKKELEKINFKESRRKYKILNDNFKEINEEDVLFLIIDVKSLTYLQLNEYVQRLNLYKIKSDGIFFI